MCFHIDGLVQDCNIYSVLGMEILQTSTKPLISRPTHVDMMKQNELTTINRDILKMQQSSTCNKQETWKGNWVLSFHFT